MDVLIINVDSKITNIALKKIEMYHQQRGDNVTWDMPMMAGIADKTYVSCIFDYNRREAEEYEGYGAIIGGSGYDIKGVLPEKIETMKPKINIGFTTRGCIRKCPFCIVPEKEGHIRVVGDIYDFWDRESKEIVVLDNNILAMPEHFKMICEQIRDEGLTVDFCQGLDIRLVTDKLAHTLSLLSHRKQIHFAWDNVRDEKAVMDGIKTMCAYSRPDRLMFYVLIGFNSTEEEDLYRVEKLRSLGVDPFVMPYDKTDPYQRAFARWVNHKAIFKSVEWKNYTR